MKKLSIRSLLIVILALVLVFSLVACGDKGDDKPTPTPKPDNQDEKDTTNVKAFFNTLWEQSTGIGDEAIGEKDDLKVSLGLTVKLDFVDSKDGSVQDSSFSTDPAARTRAPTPQSKQRSTIRARRKTGSPHTTSSTT